VEEHNRDSDYKPDLGLHMTKITPHAKTFNFIPFKMFHISRIHYNAYSATSTINHENREFCVTLDFNKEMYAKLIDIFPADIAVEINRIFQKSFKGVEMVNLPFPIEIGVKANLGKKQSNEKEEFYPFDVTDVFLASEGEKSKKNT